MKKILVVEDEDFGANLLRLKLVKAGYEVKLVVNGEEAVNTLKSYVPDLILLDLILPLRDGFDVLAEIKQNKKLHAIPIYILSNLSQKEDIDKAKKLGANEFIVKSDITLDKLVDKIKKLFS